MTSNGLLQLAVIAQQVLEGIPLPVRNEIVVEYAERQGAPPEVLQALRGLPEKQFLSLDEIGEAIAPVQPSNQRPDATMPRPERDDVPGGEAYTDPSHQPGWTRDEPQIQEYEAQLVREPGDGSPTPGEPAPRDVDPEVRRTG